MVGLDELSGDEQTEYSEFLNMLSAAKQPSTSTLPATNYMAQLKIKNLSLGYIMSMSTSAPSSQPAYRPTVALTTNICSLQVMGLPSPNVPCYQRFEYSIFLCRRHRLI